MQYGYRWYEGKTFLLHFVESDAYSAEKSAGTVAGRMLAGTVEGRENVQNLKERSINLVLCSTVKSLAYGATRKMGIIMLARKCREILTSQYLRFRMRITA